MQLRLNLKSFIYLTFFFLILQDCTLAIGKQLLYIAPIFMLLTLLFLMRINFGKFVNKIVVYCKRTPYKYMTIFLVFMILTAFLHGLSCFYILWRIFLIFCLTVIPAILFAVFIIPEYVSYSKVLNIFTFSSVYIMLYGIIDFICKCCFQAEAPLRNILCTKAAMIAGEREFVLLERASSIFFEPSFFATFIFLFLPMTYLIYKSKVKFFKNGKVNKIFKLSLVILFWLCLFLTKSPIYIIFSLIGALIFFINDIIKFIKKYFIILFIISIILTGSITVITKINSNGNETKSVITRITAVISNINNLGYLVVADDSFATRIISTVNTYQAFKKVPIIGVGYGNAKEIMYQQYLTTDTPLTQEIVDNGIVPKKTGPSPNIFWSMLLHTGIVGTFLLYFFFFRTIYVAHKIRPFFEDKQRVLLETMICAAIGYIVISFYWSLETYPMMWFIYGVLLSFIYTYKSEKQKLQNQVN